MAVYKYQAYNTEGQLNRGKVEASNQHSAVEELKSMNLWAIKLMKQGQNIFTKEITLGAPKVSTQHFAVFCRQFATLHKSGVNTLGAIVVLSEQTESKPFKRVLHAVASEMRRGIQFSDAAALHPSVFSVIFINMVRAGELSGNLDEILNRLATFYEKEHATREKVKSALIYPAVMLVLIVLVVIFLMIFVIPSFVENFKSMGIELPLPTIIVMGISDFVIDFWYLAVLILLTPIVLYIVLNKTEEGKYSIDYAKLRMPVFGTLIQKQAIARFSRTFSSLYASGIPMLQTMTILSKVAGNEVIGKLLLESREGLKNGDSIALPFYKSWAIPSMVVQMLAIGERTGALDTMLSKVADFYEDEVDRLADRLKSLMEPLMVLLLAGVVGGIVLAIVMPTFAMIESM